MILHYAISYYITLLFCYVTNDIFYVVSPDGRAVLAVKPITNVTQGAVILAQHSQSHNGHSFL